MQVQKKIHILTPFELPDVALALASIEAGAFPLLHLGRDKKKAEEALKNLSDKTNKPFGVCLSIKSMAELKFPANMTQMLIPYGMKVSVAKEVEMLVQVHSLKEAEAAIKEGTKAIVLKGNEGAGKVAKEASFIFFQSIKDKYLNKKNIDVYVQGGLGIHNSAAVLALGAKGVILDSQVALFPESSVPKELKNTFSKFSGGETVVVNGFRVLLRRNSPSLPEKAKAKDIYPFLGGYDLSEYILPMGQDISLSVDLVEKYKKLDLFVSAFYEAAHGHIQQAKVLKTMSVDSPMAKELGVKYPISQGPMARVSDVSAFAQKVSDAGALPFLALAVSYGEETHKLVTDTGKALEGKPWGVGVLGFVPKALREEQARYILDAKPPVVIIAGGRPSLAKPFEKEGIKVFLHTPSVGLLDMFLREGTKDFIFEGRECGGHIGPLSSFVLWEKQIYRLLKEQDITPYNILFAGGIHDDFSSAFITIMTATLAARGAKVGVQMGSSYLFTKEAVESGAIVEEFQKRSVSQSEMALLEAAPGQETRSLKSPFTDFFAEEKKRLQEEKFDSKEIWMKLEDLNLGRVRIASKGVERVGDKLVKLSKKEQYEKGLYMIGDIAALRNKVITLRDLHEGTTTGSNKLIAKLDKIAIRKVEKKAMDIAIVGMACVFPDAENIEEYWKNIVLGKDCISEVPATRWNKELFYDPNTRDTDYIPAKTGGFIPTIEFDPLEFGIPPQSLASIEPTQLLSLHVAKRALDDAGYSDLSKVDNDNTSVIFGAEGATELAASYGFRASAKQAFGELPEEIKNALPRLNEDSFAGVLSNVISGRIANRLNLGGRNYTVDAACASSLAALDLGCQELYTKRSDMVLLGGADLHNGLNDYLMFGCTHALSRQGFSASFDSNADGIALGEGVAVLVLKRLEDAERDNNKIYSVIKGMGGSSDGRSLGLTAPNRNGQVKALQRAYASSGVHPSQVEMIEAHGTGTVVGDRTELGALSDMFLESGALPGQTLLGSVKTQIGHTKCAAGVAGVVKASLSLYYGIQPPILHLTAPNSSYKEGKSPFVFNSQAGIWSSERRIAGVSAFGFGGTNFHSVIESYQSPNTFATALPLWPSELFVFRGDNLDEAKELLQKIQKLVTLNSGVGLKNIAYSLATYNDKEIQISIVTTGVDELQKQLTAALSGTVMEGVYYKDKQEGKVAFMFSGQGSQRVDMARDLMVAFPSMRQLLLQNKEYEKILYPNIIFDEERRKENQLKITDTSNAQPLLGIVDFAIADYLRSLDIEPDAVAGHSYGELPALCFAGAFDSEDLISLSKDRAQAILDSAGDDKGKMVAVSLEEEELNKLLEGETEVWAVNFNSHKQIVLAGTTSGMSAFMKKMTEQKVSHKEINVACAFHSPLLNKSKDLYAEAIKDVKFNAIKLPVWSNTTAEIYPKTAKSIKNRLAEHLIQPVLFSKQVENMYEDGVRVFVETGPGKVLTGLVQSVLGEKAVAIDTEGRGKEGISYFLHAIAKYIATGRDLNFEKLFEDRNITTINLDAIDSYKKKVTNWHINGHNAVPSVGKLPSHGALPIVEPLSLNGLLSATPASVSLPSTVNSTDQVLLQYLDSMKTMIQTQRDVMLGYLGEGQIINRTIATPATVAKTAQVAPAVTSAPVRATVAQTTAVGSVMPKASVEEIKAMLLDIVSEKTGYPVDMLGLDLDLEADLSIDSIKRMEVVGALRDQLNIGGGMDESEDVIERMASIKTLNGMIEWIEELVEENSSSQPVQAIAAPAATYAPAVMQQTTVAAVVNVSAEEIKAMLLDIVSEKTGYPIDMLGLDLDLEADLSIDSIKRMEVVGALRDQLNIGGGMDESEDVIERMASIKTLNGMIEWIEELVEENSSSQSVQAIAAPAATYAPAVMQQTTVAAVVNVSAEEIKTMLLDIVSEKTGYPIDMLGLDLDLEADLSIDSIKRMEVVGALRDQLNIGGGMDESEDVIERMASIKTLNGMIEWIEELIEENRPSIEIQEAVIVAETTASSNGSGRISFDIDSILENDEGENLAKLHFSLAPWAINKTKKLDIQGKHFAITDDGEGSTYAEEIVKLLADKGATANIVTVDDKLSAYDGLIILNATKSALSYSILDVFSMIKKVDIERMKWVFSFSDILGELKNRDKISEVKDIQGFAGLLKSLGHEYPKINFRSIASKTLFEKDKLPQTVVEELNVADRSVEIIYEGKNRYHYSLKLEGVAFSEKPTLSLDKESVVLVLGGAQGISPELVSQLSVEFPCKYILVGRSPEPTKEDCKYISLEDNSKIRQYLIKEEGMRVPAEIEKRVRQISKANQIIRAIEKIEVSGAEVIYKSLNIKNEKALRTFIQGVYKKYNRIDGVIHAAGLLEDKLFSQKTLDSFENVYSTKVWPLRTLLEEIRPDIKLFVMFSSVSSTYGNKGQADYAAANSVFDLTAHVLSKKTDARILTINWGPWKGAGMVSDELEKEFNRRGVALIPLKEGGRYFVKEIKYGTENQVLVMGNKLEMQGFLKDNLEV